MQTLNELHQQAGDCVRQRDYAGALSLLEHALSQFPDDPQTRILTEILRLKRDCEDLLTDE